MEQNEFLLTHSYPEVPRIFTRKEVDIMNESRNINDKYTYLERSGLLKHACCFPKCPYYLVILATEKDKILNTRRGLYKHFARFQSPNPHFYVPNYHVSAKDYFYNQEIK